MAASASAATVTRYQASLRSPHNALHSPSNWGERSEAPHGRYIWDFPHHHYYRRTSDRSNFALRRSARRLTAHAHRCVKLKQGSCKACSQSCISLCARCIDGIALSIELTEVLGYYWLSGKLIGSLHIYTLHIRGCTQH